MLASRYGNRFFVVLEYVMKTEYQRRGTPHWHIAAWVVCFGILSRLVGRTSLGIISPLVKFLGGLFHCEIDVQVGNGRLNYINGYLAKDAGGWGVPPGEPARRVPRQSGVLLRAPSPRGPALSTLLPRPPVPLFSFW